MLGLTTERQGRALLCVTEARKEEQPACQPEDGCKPTIYRVCFGRILHLAYYYNLNLCLHTSGEKCRLDLMNRFYLSTELLNSIVSKIVGEGPLFRMLYLIR
jgi:hypothetical protein